MLRSCDNQKLRASERESFPPECNVSIDNRGMRVETIMKRRKYQKVASILFLRDFHFSGALQSEERQKIAINKLTFSHVQKRNFL